MTNIYQVSCSADVSNLPKMHELIQQAANDHPALDEETIYYLRLAADEVCSNVIEHGYSGMEPGLVTLRLEIAEDRATLSLKDSGHPFDPKTVKKPNLRSSLKKRPIGGLGIYLLNETMDEVRYETSDTGNCLTLVKRFPDNP